MNQKKKRKRRTHLIKYIIYRLAASCGWRHNEIVSLPFSTNFSISFHQDIPFFKKYEHFNYMESTTEEKAMTDGSRLTSYE